jgi:uncharacterized protein YjiS (DUF1127 family)
MLHPKSGTFALNGTTALVPVPLAAHTAAARPASWIANAFRTQATRFLAWRARRLTMRLLASLDSATLRDLGLTDIESEVYGDPRDRMRGYDRNWWQNRH